MLHLKRHLPTSFHAMTCEIFRPNETTDISQKFFLFTDKCIEVESFVLFQENLDTSQSRLRNVFDAVRPRVRVFDPCVLLEYRTSVFGARLQKIY